MYLQDAADRGRGDHQGRAHRDGLGVAGNGLALQAHDAPGEQRQPEGAYEPQ